MNAYSSFAPPISPLCGPVPDAGHGDYGDPSSNTFDLKWSALHDAARVVAMLAGVSAEPTHGGMRDFPLTMRDAGGWRRDLCEQGIDDLSAIMEPGLAALLSVHSRGADPAPAALALWQEFAAARNALLALAPPSANLAPSRFA
ncbi:hypothetical protein B0I00_2561 [Novosphingobium kunmingense]|uniref:Uncharacterized protein n=1 Tax=Novosphingobium kunmingense TaxID=1211806 RepID=A0A2N0H4T0_9SPHN|nr:hypothetical protein [Novosphingobium kunmingense]PKB13933.1 hypothetical protein B0I00_2561 [Novosphingobium kunmingense]